MKVVILKETAIQVNEYVVFSDAKINRQVEIPLKSTFVFLKGHRDYYSGRKQEVYLAKNLVMS